MKAVIWDLECVPDPDLPYEGEGFAPAPHWAIVAFASLRYHSGEWSAWRCLGTDEVTALVEFAKLLAAHRPLMVTFNGRRFDVPVVKARSMRHGVSQEVLFAKAYDYRFSADGHLDLADFLTGYGAGIPFSLDTACKLIGIDGKGDVSGADVGELWAAGEHDRVREYGLDDVAKTARLWLRTRALMGDSKAARDWLALDAFLEREVRR